MTNSPASRRANVSRARRLSTLVLVTGLVPAGALGVAALWVPWLGLAGVVLAAAAGVAALVVAGREFVAYRAERNAEAGDAARAATEQLHQVRADHTSVMHVLTSRSEALRGQLRQAVAEAGELKSQTSRLRGDNEALRVENTGLRAEVAGLRAGQDAPAADVVSLPRRRATAGPVGGWEAGEAQTVIDLDLARLATPFVEDALRRHAN